MSDVFLSYKREDRDRVRPLVDALVAEGLRVWWDVQIEGGAAWRETIRANLDTASCVIVVWSHGSTGPEGHFVQDEAARALRRGKYLPVVIDPVEAPLGFGQHQSLDLVGWRGSRRDPRFFDLLATTRAVMDGSIRPSPTARAAPPRQGRGRAFAVGTVALGGLALVAGLLAVPPGVSCHVAGIACAPPPAAATAVIAKNSIAVLPLANLSGDPAQEYFSDGLTDELIDGLARLGQLQVVSRISSSRFKNTRELPAAIGVTLGVAYLLDGSVRRSGELVRITATLVDARTGFERWSNTYNRSMKGVFAVQSGVAQAVAEALRIQLLGQDIAALSRGGTANPEAFDAYLRGRRLFDAGGGEAVYRQALSMFEAATRDDPRFAAAHAARARTLLTIGNQFVPPEKVRPIYAAALESARRAVQLSPDLAQAQATLGEVLHNTTSDAAGARQAFASAMKSGSGDADILTMYSIYSSEVGHGRAAVDAVKRAAKLDPLNPRVFRALAYDLVDARRYDEATQAMRRALELNPGAPGAHALIGEALFLRGQYAVAKAEYDLEPLAYLRLAGQAMTLQKLGDAAGAAAAFRNLIADKGETSLYQQVQVLAQWGQFDHAIVALDAAFAGADSGVTSLATDPLMDPLRANKRFASRLTRVARQSSQ